MLESGIEPRDEGEPKPVVPDLHTSSQAPENIVLRSLRGTGRWIRDHKYPIGAALGGVIETVSFTSLPPSKDIALNVALIGLQLYIFGTLGAVTGAVVVLGTTERDIVEQNPLINWIPGLRHRNLPTS